MTSKKHYILTIILTAVFLISSLLGIGTLSGAKAETKTTKAQISFIIDDCYGDNDVYGTEDFINAFDTYGYKLGLAVITSWSASGNGFSPTALRNAFGNGHEILSHTVNHENKWVGTNIYSQAQAIDEAVKSYEYLTSYGLEVSGFVTPFTSTDTNLLTALKTNATYKEIYGTCTDSSRDNKDIIPRKWLNKNGTQNSSVTNSVENIKAEIDQLITSGGKGVYFTHKKDEWDVSYFNEVLAYLKQKSDEIEVVTPRELVSSTKTTYGGADKKSHVISSTEKTDASAITISLEDTPTSIVYPDLTIEYTYHSAGGNKYPTLTFAKKDGTKEDITGYRFTADNTRHKIRINAANIDFGNVSSLTVSAWSSFTIHKVTLEWVVLSTTAENIKDARQLVAEFGAGWNLGNSLDIMQTDASETALKNRETTQEIIDEVAKIGFKSVRITASWEYHADSSGKIKTDYLNRVKEVVDYVLKAGMNAVLDYHHPVIAADKSSSTDPTAANKTTGLRTVSEYWAQIATAFKDYDQRLSFEILNEPRDRGQYYANAEIWTGCKEAAEILNEYNAKAVEVIRQTGGNNPNRLLILPTYANSTGETACKYFALPENAGNVAIAVHSYTPHDFAFGGDLNYVTFSRQEYNELEEIISDIYDRLSGFGVPVIITETGATNKYNKDERAKWAYAFTSLAAKYNIPCFIWDNGVKDTANTSNPYQEAFGLLNRTVGGDLEWFYPDIAKEFIRGAGKSGSDDDTTEDITFISEETNPTYDGSWTNFELKLTNTAKINSGDKLELVFKSAFVNGSGAAVEKAYNIYVGESLVSSGNTPIPDGNDPVVITCVFTENYSAADIYFRYRYGKPIPCISAVLKRASSDPDQPEVEEDVTFIDKETNPTYDSSWTNYELKLTNTAKINSGDKLELVFKSAFVNGSGAAVEKAYNIYVGEKLVASGNAPIPDGDNPVVITCVFTENHAAADIYFRYQYGKPIPCVSAVLKRVGNDGNAKKLNFYDENGNIIAELSDKDYSVTDTSVLPVYSVTNKIFVGWKIGENLYRAGASVSAETVKTNDDVYAMAIEFKTLSDAYFRIGETAGVSGIAFDTAFNTAAYEKIKNFVTEYGTLILPTETLNGKDFTLENFIADKTVLKVKSTSATVKDGTTTFRGAIFSLKKANYNRKFSARGYLTVKYADNSIGNFYSEIAAENSVAYMAHYYKTQKNAAYLKLSDDKKAIVDAYAAAYSGE